MPSSSGRHQIAQRKTFVRLASSLHLCGERADASLAELVRPKPADLPILLPSRFELVINMTTAKTLGIDVPLSLMVRADEMID